MTGFDMPLIISGCAVAATLLLLGMAIGLGIGRIEPRSLLDGRHEMRQAGLIASRLQQLTNDVSTIVDEHRAQIDQAIQQLATSRHRDRESIAGLVMDVVSNVVDANQSLHARLTSAENLLQEQAAEIESHISLSVTDPLTGLLNRRGFDEQLQTRLAAHAKHGEAFSVLLLDLDYFKQINDQYGHMVGDRMLVAVSAALRRGLRQEDAVARYGGEEFAILLPDTTLEEGIVVAHKVNGIVARSAIEEGGIRLNVTASAGLAMITLSEDGQSLLGRADAALYAAKGAGRNGAFLHNGIECRPIAGLPPMVSSTNHQFTRDASQATVQAELSALARISPSESDNKHIVDAQDGLISQELVRLGEEMRHYLAGDRTLECPLPNPQETT